MELEELKSAWNKVSSTDEKSRQLHEEEFKKILKKRTADISDKIGRNIRIGIGIILGWVCLSFASDFLLTPFIEENINKPYLTDEILFYTFLLEIFNYLLIFTAIIIFWIRYNKIEKANIDVFNLKRKLTGIIKAIESYRRMFYIALILICIYIIVSFSSGFILESNYQINELEIDPKNITFIKWIVIILGYTVTLGVLIGIYFLLFNLFFKRLYGRYLKQLKSTLKEIEEPTYNS
ncbi:MAG: hypothetical protein PF541_08070 [Prolixibacteraceae bacterium]|jgi:flagellar biosynthesis protein FlhB|nr:hypothetical protein [Prolixibacteraceae bacterium]